MSLSLLLYVGPRGFNTPPSHLCVLEEERSLRGFSIWVMQGLGDLTWQGYATRGSLRLVVAVGNDSTDAIQCTPLMTLC